MDLEGGGWMVEGQGGGVWFKFEWDIFHCDGTQLHTRRASSGVVVTAERLWSRTNNSQQDRPE